MFLEYYFISIDNWRVEYIENILLTKLVLNIKLTVDNKVERKLFKLNINSKFKKKIAKNSVINLKKGLDNIQ